MTVLHATVTGPAGAPALILAASLGTTGAMWAPQVGPLAVDLRVITFDHRGHGSSPVPPGPYTMAELGTDVLDTLDALGIESFGYAGLSMGGTVGIWLAASAPGRIERLALLCTSACYGNPQGWLERAHTVRRDGTAAVADAVVGRWFTPQTARERPDVVARHRQMLVDTPDEGYAGCCEALAEADLRQSLAGITVPTLIVAGGSDPSTPEDPHARTLAGGIPGSRLTVIPDTAHLASAERPAEVTALLRGEFVPRLPEGSP
jgi:3-oxoadipate enol-lactonase